MKITTRNPVIVNNKHVSPQDKYLSAEGDTDEQTDALGNPIDVEDYGVDGMNILTRYPVIVNGVNQTPKDYFLNAEGDDEIPVLKPKSPTSGSGGPATLPTKSGGVSSGSKNVRKDLRQAKAGQAKEKMKGFLNKVKNSPFAQYAAQQALGYLANGGDPYSAQGNYGDPNEYTNYQDPADRENDDKMSKGTKTALIVGGIVVGGLIIYAMFAKKGTKTE